MAEATRCCSPIFSAGLAMTGWNDQRIGWPGSEQLRSAWPAMSHCAPASAVKITDLDLGVDISI